MFNPTLWPPPPEATFRSRAAARVYKRCSAGFWTDKKTSVKPPEERWSTSCCKSRREEKFSWRFLTCDSWTPSSPQDGAAELDPMAPPHRGAVVTRLLSALVLWTESRREAGPGPALRHSGSCKRWSASWLLHRSLLCPLILMSFFFFCGQQVVETPCGVLGCEESPPFPRLYRMKGFLVSSNNLFGVFCWF